MGQHLSLVTEHSLPDFQPGTWIPFLQSHYHLIDILADLPGAKDANDYRDATLRDGEPISYIHLLGPLGAIQIGPSLVYLHSSENYHQFINIQIVQNIMLKYCREFAACVGGNALAIMPCDSIGQYASEWIENDLSFDEFLSQMTEQFGESTHEISSMDFMKNWHVSQIAG